MKKIVTLPRNIEVDVFALPDDFDEQIRQAFADYTNGTSSDYTYQDKLAFIDCMRKHLHHAVDSAECVKDLVLETYEANLDEQWELTDISEFQTLEFMEYVFDKGRTNLYAHYTGDHHIDEKIMEMVLRIIKIIVEWEAEDE